MIKVIAEIGWNHCGDMQLAKQMAKAAQKSGATYAKYQTWSVNRLKPGSWDNDGRRQIYEKAELSRENHIELINYCNKIGIKFLSSVFSINDAELLVELGCKEVKIPSFESGTSTFNEIEHSTTFMNTADWYILHCVSTYPCLPTQANLLRMNRLKDLGFEVGYSDHIQGIESAKVAIGEGARVVEKHFTINNNLPGRDNKFAILPRQMEDLTNFIKLREEMFMSYGDDFQKSELDSRINYAGRFNG